MPTRNTILQLSTPTLTLPPQTSHLQNSEILLIYHILLSSSHDHFVYVATNMRE